MYVCTFFIMIYIYSRSYGWKKLMVFKINMLICHVVTNWTISLNITSLDCLMNEQTIFKIHIFFIHYALRMCNSRWNSLMPLQAWKNFNIYKFICAATSLSLSLKTQTYMRKGEKRIVCFSFIQNYFTSLS